MSDVGSLSYDIGTTPISGSISESWCPDVGVYPIPEPPTSKSDKKITRHRISWNFPYRVVRRVPRYRANPRYRVKPPIPGLARIQVPSKYTSKSDKKLPDIGNRGISDVISGKTRYRAKPRFRGCQWPESAGAPRQTRCGHGAAIASRGGRLPG